MTERNTRIRAGQIANILPDDIDATVALGTGMDGYVPSYDEGTGKFTWITPGGGASSLEDLSDIEFDTGTPLNDYILQYDDSTGILKFKAKLLTTIHDADNDTKIEIEQSADEDKIRFTTSTTQRAIIDSNGLKLESGADVNEFSIDGTMAGESDDAVPTEKAVKTYVDANAGKISADYIDDFTIKFEAGKIKVADRIELNIMLNFFHDAIDESRSVYNLIDGIIDEFVDEAGVDTPSSTNEFYNSTEDYYTPDRDPGGINSNTNLLFHADGQSGGLEIIDSGNTGHIVTQNNNATLTFPPFSGAGGHGVFNGTNTTLSIPDSSDWDIVASNLDDWTIDLWVKFNNNKTGRFIGQGEDTNNWWYFQHEQGNGLRFAVRSNAGTIIDTGFGGEITDTNWHHIALCKVASEYACYLDGTQVNYVDDSDTDAFTGSLYMGALVRPGDSTFDYLDGNLDEIRIIKSNYFSSSPDAGKTDTITVPNTPYTTVTGDSVNLLLHLENNVIDSSNSGHTVTNNNVTFEYADKKFGSTGLFLDGTADYLSIPDSDDWYFGTGDFTIDFWVNFLTISTAQEFMNQWQSADDTWYIGIDASNKLKMYFEVGNVIKSDYIMTNAWSGLTTNTWHHLEFVRDTISAKIFIDGISQTLTENVAFSTNDVGNLASSLNIGVWANYLDGFIDEFRISKGVARHTTNFTPPTSEYTSDSNTKLLLHMNSHDISGDGNNVNYHIPTFTNVSIDISTYKWVTGSFTFNGVSSYISIPDSSDWDIFADSSDDWTIEFWLKQSDHSGNDHYINQGTNSSNYWTIGHTHGSGLYLGCYVSGSPIVLTPYGGEITDSDWHHIAVCKVADEYGMYKDGVQINYVSDTSITTFEANLNIGAFLGSFQFYSGYMDEIRIQHNNEFSASPNVGLTDTITVPTEAYTTSTQVFNMTLISESDNADADPDTSRIVIFEEDVDSITLNTDIKAYVSKDGGVTFAQATLTDAGDYSGSKRILTGTADLTATGIATGTGFPIVWKIETLNNKDIKFHGVGTLWD